MLRTKPYTKKNIKRYRRVFDRRGRHQIPNTSIYQVLSAVRTSGVAVGVVDSFVALGEVEYGGAKSWKLESEERLCVSLGIRVQELEREVNHLRAKAKSSGCSGLASREAFYHKRYP